MAQAARPPLGHRRQPSRLTPRTDEPSTVTSGPRHTHDDSTVKYIKRTLCARPAKPALEETAAPEVEGNLEDLLPRLTSRTDIDVQLYAILAVILSQFVQSWYNRITPDADFVGEVVQIIAHCTRDLEERLKLVDLESLLLNELPGLLDAHLDAVEVAIRSGRSQYGVSLAAVYQTLRPHKALSPLPIDETSALSQHNNEVDWSQLLVDSVLPLALPPDDLVNPCLNVVVAEIFSEMIVRNAIVGRVCQPWLLWEGCTKALYALKPKPPSEAVSSPLSKLEQFGLLSSAEAVRHETSRQRPPVIQTVISASWAILRYIVLTWTLMRIFLLALMQASALPTRSRRVKRAPDSPDKLEGVVAGAVNAPRPVIGMRIWLMSAQIHDRLLNPALLPPILQVIRSVVFPDNVLGPARQLPSREETVEIKRECARAIVDVLPETARTLYFATKDTAEMQADVESTLDLFADAYINKHLIVAALELLIVRLFPETAETGD
ncbi:hypothetical protein B0A55_08380 [Friedmanniomyces simplex]|uniref:PXA domain-containing protein n=1 Tax=Friedmanniomyces simplex TaxID=329884 RepID=A0A4U0WXT0_9PEZI|nr:hypothetical protein B0A55_08380 [Friedmanniomyces simplex]